MPDIDGLQFLRVPVTMQPAFSNNSLQVIDVGDVIDGRHALMVTDGPVVRFLRLHLNFEHRNSEFIVVQSPLERDRSMTTIRRRDPRPAAANLDLLNEIALQVSTHCKEMPIAAHRRDPTGCTC